MPDSAQERKTESRDWRVERKKWETPAGNRVGAPMILRTCSLSAF